MKGLELRTVGGLDSSDSERRQMPMTAESIWPVDGQGMDGDGRGVTYVRYRTDAASSRRRRRATSCIQAGVDR